jgi:release factor glutamine methyltransferase
VSDTAQNPDKTGQNSPKVWTVLELLRWTTDHFSGRGIETARLDAECLLAAALGVERMRLYIDFDKPVTPEARAVYRAHVVQRGTHRVPVSQLIGEKEFWSMPLRVTADVLTPRPDSETLVVAALDRVADREAPISVLDVGTGSGAIALAIARERPKALVTATDISAAALRVAEANAESLGLADRVAFAEGPLFEPVVPRQFDLVVSNPPYLAESERAGLAPELGHEPDVALFGGADGLEVIRAMVAEIPQVLAPGGGFALELAPAQAETVANWVGKAGLEDVTIHRDLAELPRVVSARAAPRDSEVPPGPHSEVR